MMKPLTELDIRMMVKKNGDLKKITVQPDTLITPSAAEYVNMMQIELVFADNACAGGNVKGVDPVPPVPKEAAGGDKPVFYAPDGGVLDYKPEALTHLHGNHLVYKDHPMIRWRGKLDTLAAMIIDAQALGMEKGNQAYIGDLEEILEFVRSLLPSEYKGTPVEEFHLLGMSSCELRERSHHPKKHYGFPHMRADYRMGPLSIRLNLLRAAARETELAAAAAFKDEAGKPVREDIMEALNRLSSVFYIMMYKYLPKDFIPASAGI